MNFSINLILFYCVLINGRRGKDGTVVNQKKDDNEVDRDYIIAKTIPPSDQFETKYRNPLKPIRGEDITHLKTIAHIVKRHATDPMENVSDVGSIDNTGVYVFNLDTNTSDSYYSYPLGKNSDPLNTSHIYTEGESDTPRCHSDTCQYMLSHNITHRDMSMKCFCDEQCKLYGDCCADLVHTEYYKTSKTPRILPNVTECTNLRPATKPNGPFYMIGKCPRHIVDHTLKKNCENVTEGGLHDWPVSSNTTRYLYSSVYCAACNNDIVDLLYWKVRCICNFKELIGESNMTLVKTQMNDTVQRAKIVKNIIMKLDKTSGCTVFEPPSEHLAPTSCVDSVDNCSPMWHDTHLMESAHCSNHTAYVYWNDPTGPVKPYRNWYCALCNRVEPSQLMCSDHRYTWTDQTSELSLSLLFDMNPGTGDDLQVGMSHTGNISIKLGKVRQCEVGHVFSPFTHTCQLIKCPNGFRVDNSGNRCMIEKLLLPSDAEQQPNNTRFPCPMIPLGASATHVFLPNESLFVNTTSELYDKSEYILNGTDIMICTISMNRSYKEWLLIDQMALKMKFSSYQGYLSLVGMILSLVSLALLLGIYCLLSKLRNTPGKNLMCLSSSLFIGQLLFLTGVTGVHCVWLCKIVAISIHYSFLSAFFWMNIMSFDIWQTFSSNIGYDSGKKTQKFKRYCIYAYTVPFIIVSTATILDLVIDDPKFKPSYGEKLCWINNRYPLAIFFAGPISLTTLTNCIFYILTVRSLLHAQKLQVILQKPSDKWRFVLYIKLSFIMGLAWIFGFIASLTEEAVLWTIFIVLNSTQGLFLFLAFVCNKKVYRLLKKKCCSGNESLTTSKTLTSSLSSFNRVFRRSGQYSSTHSKIARVSGSNL